MLTRGRVLGLLLTVVFLGLALRQVDPATLANELRAVNYAWLLPSALCTLGGYVLRTLRWQTLLTGAARAPFRTLFPVLIMGFATNNLLPGRLGEFWRAYLLGRKRNVRKTTGLTSVFVERVFDGLTLIAILAVVARMVDLPDWGQRVQALSAAIFLAATLVVAVLLWQPGFARAVWRLAARFLPARFSTWGGDVLEAFLGGLAPLRHPKTLLAATLLSIGVWSLEGASYLLLSRGIFLGLNSQTELPALGLTLVSINLGIMVPSAPGYVGTQEFFGQQALSVFGVTAEAALALVLVSHAIQYALVTSLGLVFFAREHLSPTSLASRRVVEAEPLA